MVLWRASRFRERNATGADDASPLEVATEWALVWAFFLFAATAWSLSFALVGGLLF